MTPFTEKRWKQSRSKKFTPEFTLFARESNLGFAAEFLYNLFPEAMARFLHRVFPRNSSVRDVVDTYDYRKRHGFPAGYIPAGYQLPLKDQG